MQWLWLIILSLHWNQGVKSNVKYLNKIFEKKDQSNYLNYKVIMYWHPDNLSMKLRIGEIAGQIKWLSGKRLMTVMISHWNGTEKGLIISFSPEIFIFVQIAKLLEFSSNLRCEFKYQDRRLTSASHGDIVFFNQRILTIIRNRMKVQIEWFPRRQCCVQKMTLPCHQ